MATIAQIAGTIDKLFDDKNEEFARESKFIGISQFDPFER